MMDSGRCCDDDVNIEAQDVVNMVFASGRKLRASAIIREIMLNLSFMDSTDRSESFLRDLEKTLDPHSKDPIVDDEEFYQVLKNLFIKYQGMDFISSSISPIKCLTSELSISKHNTSSYSLSGSDVSLSTSPSANIEDEVILLRDDCDKLKSYAKRLEENKNDLIKQLSLAEDKNSELEGRCKELEEWKTNYELTSRFSFENNNWTGDAEANDTPIKELESRITLLEKELSVVRKQCNVLEDENLELLTFKNDYEEVQRHAEKLHRENEEYAQYLQLKDQEIMALKLESDEKEAVFNERLVNVEEEYKTLLAAMQKNVAPPISLESSFEDEPNVETPCLKDELGSSFTFLNTSVDSTSSGVEASAVEADSQPTRAEVKPVHNCCPFYNERELQIAELRKLNSLLAEYSNDRHSKKWKVFLAIVAYPLRNCVFGYLVVCAVIFLVSPYLNYDSLIRSKPWFVSVSAGLSSAPPV